jgi:ABC-type transporter Mla MlaB component
MSKEIGLTPPQLASILSKRPAIHQERKNMATCELMIKELRAAAGQHLRSLHQTMDEIQTVMTPTQLAKFYLSEHTHHAHTRRKQTLHLSRCGELLTRLIARLWLSLFVCLALCGFIDLQLVRVCRVTSTQHAMCCAVLRRLASPARCERGSGAIRPFSTPADSACLFSTDVLCMFVQG